MLILISPAKTLDFNHAIPAMPTSRPRFADEAIALAAAASRLSERRLSALMHISPNLARLNVDRFRGFPDLPERAAIFAFAGDVYVGFDVHSMDEDAFPFVQDHLRIISGLYGLLRPLDAIRAYRLEMGTRWAPRRANLYSFWHDKIANELERELHESDSNVVINLASKEYWSAVGPRLSPEIRVIEIDFRETGPAGLRFNSFAAKRARGMMARFICDHRLSDPEQIKQFDGGGYRFDPRGSDAGRWRFLRC